MDKKVLRNISYGLYVLTSKDNDKNVGCIVNSVIQTTSNPAAKAAAIPTQQTYTNAAPSSNGNPMPARPATSKPKIDLASVEQMPADLQDYDMDDDAEVANVFANLGE